MLTEMYANQSGFEVGHRARPLAPVEAVKVIKSEHRHVDLETKKEAWRQGLAHKAIHNRNQRITSSRKDNEDSIMQELFAREILPAWRAARAFVGGPEVAGTSSV
uniref:Uncharacterized protein n=1 Tax=Cryptomonas curvata TaxID=233186 RepID=A0A7S0MNA3_9CRYP